MNDLTFYRWARTELGWAIFLWCLLALQLAAWGLVALFGGGWGLLWGPVQLGGAAFAVHLVRVSTLPAYREARRRSERDTERY